MKTALRVVTIVLFLALSAGLIHAQQPTDGSLSKADLYEYAQQIAKNKIRVSTEKIMQIMNEKWPDSLIELSGPSTSILEERNSGEDAPVNISELPESEVHAAINPQDTNHIVVASMQQTATSLTFSVYVTQDCGITWTQSPFIGLPNDQQLAGGGDPILFFDQDDNVYFSWITLTLADQPLFIDMIIHLALSTDGGLNWEIQESTPIDEALLFFNFVELTGDRLVDKEWIAIDNQESPYHGRIYSSYMEFLFADTSYHILVSHRHIDSLNVQSDSIDVSLDSFFFAQYPSIDVDRLGNVHLLFAGMPDTSSNVGLYYLQSTDGGLSFTPPSLISELSLDCFPRIGEVTNCSGVIEGVDDLRLYPCPHLRVDKSGGIYDGNLYVTWTANGIDSSETEGTNIYFIKSTSNGVDWSSPSIINDPEQPTRDDFFSILEVNPNGDIYLNWYDRREDPNNIMTKYYGAISNDGGNSFGPAFPISSEAADFSVIGSTNNGFGVGEYNSIVSTENYFFSFWGDGRTNDGNVNIYMAKIPVEGNPPVGWQEISSISDKLVVKGPFPNPTAKDISLNIILKERSNLSIQILDLNGRLVHEEQYSAVEAGEHTYQINQIASFANGLYICSVKTDFGFKNTLFEVSR